jgi:hypothetical protein
MDPLVAVVYDPEALILNVTAEILRRPVFVLHRFELRAAGVYMLFYKGQHKFYRRAARSPDATLPIYVGKTGNLGQRLNSHHKTIGATDLRVEDFEVRVLPLPGIWPEMVERVLLGKYLEPLWNTPEWAGFGNDGSPRASGNGSRWDVMHPATEGRRVSKKAHPDADVFRQEALRVLHAKADQRASMMLLPLDTEDEVEEQVYGGGGVFDLFG